MNEMHGHQIRLRMGAMWSTTARDCALCLRCDDGVVWVTEECDNRDVVLHTGGVFGAQTGGLVAVQALTDATIATESLAGPDVGTRSPLPHLTNNPSKGIRR